MASIILYKAMPGSWPPTRFSTASKAYRLEFQELLIALSLGTPYYGPSNIRERLGDFIGRAIRFYLRRFFDPVPLCITAPSEKSSPMDLSNVRSRVHEIVEMAVPEGGERDTAAADGSISSVFSVALRRIKEFFELRSLLETQGEPCAILNALSTSDASKQGIGDPSSLIIITDEDLIRILSEVHDIHTILAGVRACKFVHELMCWPGVESAMKEAGGFDKVEQYALLFKTLDLPCPEESHFTLLENIGNLMKRLSFEIEGIEAMERMGENSLREIWHLFRCGEFCFFFSLVPSDVVAKKIRYSLGFVCTSNHHK